MISTIFCAEKTKWRYNRLWSSWRLGMSCRWNLRWGCYSCVSTCESSSMLVIDVYLLLLLENDIEYGIYHCITGCLGDLYFAWKTSCFLSIWGFIFRLAASFTFIHSCNWPKEGVSTASWKYPEGKLAINDYPSFNNSVCNKTAGYWYLWSTTYFLFTRCYISQIEIQIQILNDVSFYGWEVKI